MENKLKIFLFSGFFLILSACSSQQLYNAAQDNRKNHCQQLPPIDQENCYKDLNEKSYPQYIEEKKQVQRNQL